MKQQKEFYTIAQNGTNKFLTKYENREQSLTFSAGFTNDVRCVLIFEKGDEETNKSMENLAKAVVAWLKLKLSMKLPRRMAQI